MKIIETKEVNGVYIPVGDSIQKNIKTKPKNKSVRVSKNLISIKRKTNKPIDDFILGVKETKNFFSNILGI